MFFLRMGLRNYRIICIMYFMLQKNLVTKKMFRPNLDPLFHVTIIPVHLSTLYKVCHSFLAI